MGCRGKLIVEHTGITLPKEFAEKYIEYYYIGQLNSGEYVLNISSKVERKGHIEILTDLKELLRGQHFGIYCAILWEDGKIERHNLSNGDIEYLT